MISEDGKHKCDAGDGGGGWRRRIRAEDERGGWAAEGGGGGWWQAGDIGNRKWKAEDGKWQNEDAGHWMRRGGWERGIKMENGNAGWQVEARGKDNGRGWEADDEGG